MYLQYTNIQTFINGFLSILCCITAIIVAIASFYRRNQIKTFSQLMFFALAMCGWNFIYAIYFLVPDNNLLPLIDAVGYTFVAFSALTFFFFSYCHFTEKEHLGIKLFVPLIIIPILTSIFAIMYPVTGFFQTYTGEINYTPFRHLITLYGPWFYIHSIYSYALILVGSILLVIKSLNKKTRNRKMYFLIASIAILYCLQNIAMTFLPTEMSTISTRIMHFLLLNIFFWATYLDNNSTIIYFGKYTYIEKQTNPLLIFNLKHELIHANPSGHNFFKEIQLPYKKYIFFNTIFNDKTFTMLGKKYFDNNAECFYIQQRDTKQVYYIQNEAIRNKKNKLLGYSLTLNNMKTLDSLIENLEKHAYLDSLCQCSNRALYDEQKNSFLETAHFPCAIAIADLDNLKKVNDSFGHRDGDDYIKTSCLILQSMLGKDDLLFRYGGDVFILLLQNTSVQKLDHIVKKIEVASSHQNKEYEINISFGYSLIENSNTNFEKHFEIADFNMYQQKIRRKSLL
jgi:diguanylate cyclase (GGDEF)-like protein